MEYAAADTDCSGRADLLAPAVFAGIDLDIQDCPDRDETRLLFRKMVVPDILGNAIKLRRGSEPFGGSGKYATQATVNCSQGR
jgi:hypothetical protein